MIVQITEIKSVQSNKYGKYFCKNENNFQLTINQCYKMNEVYLSETEKALLLSLSIGYGFKLNGVDEKEIGVAATKLRDYGFIKANITHNIIVDAQIDTKGEIYVKENPNLKNPVDDNVLKQLQINELEYKQRLRKQETIIRAWKLTAAIAGIIGIIGWIVAFVAKSFN